MVRKKDILVNTSLIVVLLSLTACSGVVGSGQDTDQTNGVSNTVSQVELPVVDDPTIDGTITDQEWRNATVHHFKDGSEVYLMVSGGDLFLAIRAVGGGMIAGNVFLEEGDQISILHTSAALGTALYQKDGGQYRKIKDFSWCCRSKIDNEASRLVREEFFTEEGWLGVNSFLGTENELEYRISLAGQPEKIAVNFIHADGEEDKQVWPVDLEDGVSLPSSGGFPDLIEFSIEEWISLEDMQ